MPMCSDVLIKSWSKSMESLIRHIGYKGYRRSTPDETLLKNLEKDKVYIMGKIVPPRECDTFEQVVWVSVEVRHTVGNLKNIPNADMITMKVSPEDLMPMVDTSGYSMELNGVSSRKYSRKTSKKRKDVGDGDFDQIVINRFIFASKTCN